MKVYRNNFLPLLFITNLVSLTLAKKSIERFDIFGVNIFILTFKDVNIALLGFDVDSLFKVNNT